MIELIMVIVILGVLAAVAIPKFDNLTAQATEAAEAGVFGGVKAALAVYYAEQSAAGVTDSQYLWPKDLEDVSLAAGADTNEAVDDLFGGVLKDPISPAADKWEEDGVNSYQGPTDAYYTYNNTTGTFSKD